MNSKFITSIAAACLLLHSCGNSNKKTAAAADTAQHQHHTMTLPPPEKKFAGVIFANEKDYICGMPVRAGVDDTAHYKNKVYGFCAKECKEEFLKNPKQYLTAKK